MGGRIREHETDLFLLTTSLTFDWQLAILAHALRAEVSLRAEAVWLLTVQMAATERFHDNAHTQADDGCGVHGLVHKLVRLLSLRLQNVGGSEENL